MLYALGTLLSLFLSVYSWLELRTACRNRSNPPFRAFVAVGLSDGMHFALIGGAAIGGAWLLPIDASYATVAGSVLTLVGLFLIAVNVMGHSSPGVSSKIRTPEMPTVGIYRYSRNPWYAGWLLALAGMSTVGRSLLALLLTVVLIIRIYLYNATLGDSCLGKVFEGGYSGHGGQIQRLHMTLERGRRS